MEDSGGEAVCGRHSCKVTVQLSQQCTWVTGGQPQPLQPPVLRSTHEQEQLQVRNSQRRSWVLILPHRGPRVHTLNPFVPNDPVRPVSGRGQR